MINDGKKLDPYQAMLHARRISKQVAINPKFMFKNQSPLRSQGASPDKVDETKLDAVSSRMTDSSYDSQDSQKSSKVKKPF